MSERLKELGFGDPYDGLIPIRFDLTAGGVRFVDAVLWPCDEADATRAEQRITPLMFARQTVADEGLPQALVPAIAAVIQRHEEDAALARRTVTALAARESECRDRCEKLREIQLEVRVGRIIVRDRFEWNIAQNSEDCPDSYAARLCAELRLSTAHAAAVSFALREQIHTLRHKELLGGLTLEARDERGVSGQSSAVGADEENRNVVRSLEESVAWGPHVLLLTPEDVERIERNEMRQARLARRNRGRSSVLDSIPSPADAAHAAAPDPGTVAGSSRLSGLKQTAPNSAPSSSAALASHTNSSAETPARKKRRRRML